MQQVGYINNAGKNIKVEFTLMQNRIAPKNAQDAEILISAWDINDEILEAFFWILSMRSLRMIRRGLPC